MHARTLQITLVLQIIGWSLFIWAMQSSPIQTNAYLQTATPSPFLREIFYGRQDVWQIFDHNLPYGGG